MAKLTAEIIEGDEESDLISFFIKACGISLRDFHNDSRILTKEIFEANFDKVLDIVETRSSSRKTYLILGYLILLTGSHLPADLRSKIIEATKWEYEKGLWDERFIRERKFYLRDLRDKIRAHKPGVKLHLVYLKNAHDENFTHGVIGLNQFWDYVDSGKINTVKHINLDSCNLTEIPNPIFELRSLETLSLDNNKLNEISHHIGELYSLKKLFLDGNQLKTIPKNMIQLDSLEILSLERNYFKSVPTFVSKLKSLKKLYLRNNFISEIPEFLQKKHIIVLV